MSDFFEFICSGCKLSTVSKFALEGKPHLDCPQGYGEWQEYKKEIDYSTYTVTVHVSPDCAPETLQALGEMMKLLIQQVEKVPSQRSHITMREPDVVPGEEDSEWERVQSRENGELR